MADRRITLEDLLRQIKFLREFELMEERWDETCYTELVERISELRANTMWLSLELMIFVRSNFGVTSRPAWNRIEAMICSMTADERIHPETIDQSRCERIARGSGVTPADIEDLLKRFERVEKILARFPVPVTYRQGEIDDLFDGWTLESPFFIKNRLT